LLTLDISPGHRREAYLSRYL